MSHNILNGVSFMPRKKDPELMDTIYDFIGKYYREKHVSPTIREIAKEIGTSKATVQRYLIAMSESGRIIYDGKTRELTTPQIKKCISGYFSAPIVGSICCGAPELEEEGVEEYVSLPKSIFGDGRVYILRAKGDSLADEGIEENDLVVIQMQETAEVGDIVVALDENSENTLKVYGGMDKERGEAVLCYSNKEKYPGKKIYVKQLIVQGIARQVIKNLRNG